MSQDRESFAGQKELIEDPILRAEREAANGVEQFDLVLSYVQRIEPSFKLTTRIINSLQEVALQGVHPLAGTFRNTSIEIKGSDHAPPNHLDVPDEMAAFCNYVNEQWDAATAIHLGAYALWKLNWIHPYADGNGRTARAVMYLLICKKLGNVLPGTPTIPEQISVDKGPYYDALEAADASLSAGRPDVSNLEAMLEGMLVKQLLSRPSLPDVAAKKIASVCDSRVHTASDKTKEELYGTSIVKCQLWAIGDYVVLQIGSVGDVEEAEARQRKFRNPFPKLLAFGDTPHIRHVAGQEYTYLSLAEALNGRHALLLDRDSFIAVRPESLSVSGQGSWESKSWLYIVRLGSDITSLNFPDAMDLLLARQITAAKPA